MIAKITFQTREGQPLTMLFGTSYKTWSDQLFSYLNRMSTWEYPEGQPPVKRLHVTEVTGCLFCGEKWPGWGLAWCEAEGFQELLAAHERFFPNGVPDYANFKFYLDGEKQGIVLAMLENKATP